MQRILFGSPPGSPLRGSADAKVLFESPPGSPLRGSADSKVLFGSPSDSLYLNNINDKVDVSPIKKMRVCDGTPIVSCVAPSQPPRAPTKKSRRTPDTPKGVDGAFLGFLPGSPLPSEYDGLLGTGSFGSVHSAKLSDGTPVAVKSQPIDDIFPRCDANATVTATSGERVQGCITAFYDCQNEENGDLKLRAIMPIAIPLDNLPNATMQTLLPAIKYVTDFCPLGVLMDLSLQNMGLLREGDPTIRINDDGVLVGGEPLTEDCVCAIDLGCSSNPDPSAANNNYAALNASCETPADILKIRKFKWELIRAQIMNPGGIPILELRDTISRQVFGEGF